MAKKESGDKILNGIVKDLFKMIGIKSKVEIVEDAENNSANLNIEAGDEAGLLIGNRGRTLNSLQTIIGILYKQRTGEWKRIVLDVGGWRDKENDRLTEIAVSTAERAKQTGDSQTLYNLSPAQRRIVHVVLADDNEVVTESFGDGKDRYMVINTKK